MARSFRSIPGPRGLPIIGSVLDYTGYGPFSYELLHEAKLLNYKQYGRIYKEKLGRNIIELFDPRDAELVYRNEGEYPERPALPLCAVAYKRDGIKLGFGNLNGRSWWRVRKTVAPAMLKPDAVAPFFKKQFDIAEDFVQLIENLRKNRERVSYSNLLELVRKFSIEAYGSICFNARIGCLEPEVPLSSDAHVMMTSSAAMFEAIQKTTFSFPTYAIFRTSAYNQFVEAFRNCQKLVCKYLEMNDGDEENIFLDSLINNDNNHHQDCLAFDERIGICIDLFTAGVDATAFALCFLLYNLAQNPEKQEKLREEISSIAKSGTSHADVMSLTYLRSCIKESFRLNFPVQGGPIRELERDLILSGYVVPKKTLVSMNFQTMCKLDEYFSNPDSFVPERWMKHHDVSLQDDLNPIQSINPTLDNHKPAFAFLPFGYGRRMCIGRRFAEQQITLALMKLLQHYKLETTTTNLGMLNRIFTMPDKNIQMDFVSLNH